MGLNDLQILFQKPSKTYFSGETVYGQILINLNGTKKFRQIKVVLVGEGHVHWEETRWGAEGLTDYLFTDVKVTNSAQRRSPLLVVSIWRKP